MGSSALRFPRGDRYWSRLRSSLFNYEPEVGVALRQYFGKNIVFFDCGANIGYWSAFVLGNSDAKVVAIEPNPKLIPILSENVLGKSRATVVHSALVAGEEQTAILYNDESASNHAGGTLVKPQFGMGHSVQVPTTRLNEIFRAHSTDGDFFLIKLDIEGLEQEVIFSSGLLGNPKVVWIYEDHGSDPLNRASQPFLNNRTYEVRALRRPPLQPKKVSSDKEIARIKRIKHKGYNFIAVPTQI